MMSSKWLWIGISILVLCIIAYVYLHPQEHYHSDGDLSYYEVKYATEVRHNGHSDIEIERRKRIGR